MFCLIWIKEVITQYLSELNDSIASERNERSIWFEWIKRIKLEQKVNKAAKWMIQYCKDERDVNQLAQRFDPIYECLTVFRSWDLWYRIPILIEYGELPNYVIRSYYEYFAECYNKNQILVEKDYTCHPGWQPFAYFEVMNINREFYRAV